MPRKVSEDEVEGMKSLKEEGLTYREIAEEFGFSRSTVNKYLGEGTRVEGGDYKMVRTGHRETYRSPLTYLGVVRE